jgi:predicted RNase H-like HicB family nuclease
VLTRYIRAALRRATYEILSDGTYYGEIPGFQGVYASTQTRRECRRRLREVLDGWVVLGYRLGHALPDVDGVDMEELDSIQSYDAAKASGEKAIPFEQAIAEVEQLRQ